MNILSILLLVAGLVLLIAGAEFLVKGASRLASRIGISSLVIGLTVVAFGTSAPELAVSVSSSLYNDQGANIALGNVVGSNIFNILFILGISSVVAPLFVSQQLVRKEVPVMIGTSVLLLFMSLDGTIGRGEGTLLFSGIVIYTFIAIYKGKDETLNIKNEYEESYGVNNSSGNIIRNLLYILGGLAALVAGSRWLVQGAVEISMLLGVSDVVIGLTIVSAGTSLPEVATSVMASIRGERDIAVGNVVGSNIFNILAVAGMSALVAPSGINAAQSIVSFDIPFMTAVAFACFPIFFTGFRISRWEGFIFIGYYIAYTAYLVLKTQQHDALPFFSNIMIAFVVPITVLTLLITFLNEWKKTDR